MTPTLEGLCSSTELFPQAFIISAVSECNRRAKRAGDPA